MAVLACDDPGCIAFRRTECAPPSPPRRRAGRETRPERPCVARVSPRPRRRAGQDGAPAVPAGSWVAGIDEARITRSQSSVENWGTTSAARLEQMRASALGFVRGGPQAGMTGWSSSSAAAECVDPRAPLGRSGRQGAAAAIGSRTIDDGDHDRRPRRRGRPWSRDCRRTPFGPVRHGETAATTGRAGRHALSASEASPPDPGLNASDHGHETAQPLLAARYWRGEHSCTRRKQREK